jgi:hypothetical protein
MQFKSNKYESIEYNRLPSVTYNLCALREVFKTIEGDLCPIGPLLTSLLMKSKSKKKLVISKYTIIKNIYMKRWLQSVPLAKL